MIHGCQAFIPKILEHDAPGVVINTGPTQGITLERRAAERGCASSKYRGNQRGVWVYLDDERPTPPGWERVYWPD